MKIIRNNSGFNLIELLVTVLIVGILASVAAVNYRDRKKEIEYNAAVANVRAVIGAAKNYRLSLNTYPSTFSTAATNSVYGTELVDGVYNAYRVNMIAGSPVSFNVTVRTGPWPYTNYTFNIDGDRIACSGSDCLP